MVARRMSVIGVSVSLLLAGCVVEQRDFEALRDQVRLQQKQINDLKARQEEQPLRIDTVNNGFKILGDKAEDNSRRIDELGEGTVAFRPPVVTPPAPIPEAPPPPPPSPPPAPAPAPTVPEGPVLLTNLPKGAAPVPSSGGGGIGAAASRPDPGAAQVSAAAAVSPAGGEIITAAPKPEKLYAAALALYSGRDYQQAAAKFEEFVSSYPDHKLAGNAQYWIGECSYSLRRFSEAAEEFDQVEKVFPSSPKVPAALLKKGLSLVELKKIPEAQAALQRIVEKYPQSEEAAKARERLERLKQQ